jgi:hypothetical protein
MWPISQFGKVVEELPNVRETSAAAVKLGKNAERCFRFERGLTSSNYIRSGGRDNLHAGLLAGETLQLQLRQLARAYQTQDRRELEITKHISLRQNTPLALLLLNR